VALLLLEVDGERQVDEFAHPDFRWITADGAVIKIDQIRRLTEFAVQTPQKSCRKVAAILDAHLLNPNAANALLKTLEEPPPNTHVVLATPFWGKLLPTIRSRCQRFQVNADITQARVWLQEKGLDISQSTFAEYGHAPLSIAQSRHSGQIEITPWLAELPRASLEVSLEPIMQGDKVNWLARWYRRVLLHLGGDSIPGCQGSAAALIGFSDELLLIRQQIETSNSANARLLIERLIVRWVQLNRVSGAKGP
jgi:DNA polymerase-3 subunit delta'